jgi:hypothetical protein
MAGKPRQFKLHFNRINMQRGLDTVWTIHLSDCCIPATEVVVKVPVMAVFRPNARQPRAWLQGKGIVERIGKDKYCIGLGINNKIL